MKSLFTLFTLLLMLTQAVIGQSYHEPKPLQEHLAIVNEHWNDVEMASEMLSFTSDDERIQKHLMEVFHYLDAHTPADLDATQLESRKAHLEVLNSYALSGKFPRNNGHLERTPYFVDKFDTPCAVANLLIEDGQTDHTDQLRLENNFNYLSEMPREPIQEWASINGFEFWELEWIQPGYPYYPETRFLPSEERFNGIVHEVEFNSNEGLTCYAGGFDSLGLRSFHCKDLNGDELNFAVQPSGETFDFAFLGQEQFAIAGAYLSGGDSVGLGILDASSLSFIPLANVLSYSSHAAEMIGGKIYFDAYFNALGVSHIYTVNPANLSVEYILEVDGLVSDIVEYEEGVAIAGEFSEVIYINDTISSSNFSYLKDSVVSDLNCPMEYLTNRLRVIENALCLLGRCASGTEYESKCAYTYSLQEGWNSLLDSATVVGMNMAQGQVNMFDVIDYNDTMLLSCRCNFPVDGLGNYSNSKSLFSINEQGQVGPFCYFNSSIRSMTINGNNKLEVGGAFSSYTYQDPNATSWIQNSTVPTPFAAEIAYHLTSVDE